VSEAFNQFIGEHLEVDDRDFQIVGVQPVSQLGTGILQLVISIRAHRADPNVSVVIATFGEKKTPVWVLADLRKRLLRSHYEYDLTSAQR
jgi:hypothetical protein